MWPIVHKKQQKKTMKSISFTKKATIHIPA